MKYIPIVFKVNGESSGLIVHSPSPLSERLPGSAKILKKIKPNVRNLAALSVEEEIPS